MNWNGRFRMVRTTAVGAAVVVGAVGAALLVGPLTGAQAAKWPESYMNGGFCYQNPKEQGNASRLQFTEVDYRPDDYTAHFSWQLQEWAVDAKMYHDVGDPMQIWGVDKRYLVPSGSYDDPNEFCRNLTISLPLRVRVRYSYGEWTSRHQPTSPPASPPKS